MEHSPGLEDNDIFSHDHDPVNYTNSGSREAQAGVVT